jgi:DNA-binding NarL/FixJ family response regulator
LQEPPPPLDATPLASAAVAASRRDELVDLTEREIAVLRLVAAGLTTKEIAARLALSPRTVQAHLYRIFGKLDVTTRSAATRYALDHGLV